MTRFEKRVRTDISSPYQPEAFCKSGTYEFRPLILAALRTSPRGIGNDRQSLRTWLMQQDYNKIS